MFGSRSSFSFSPFYILYREIIFLSIFVIILNIVKKIENKLK